MTSTSRRSVDSEYLLCVHSIREIDSHMSDHLPPVPPCGYWVCKQNNGHCRQTMTIKQMNERLSTAFIVSSALDCLYIEIIITFRLEFEVAPS